jgi:hypothetical protein
MDSIAALRDRLTGRRRHGLVAAGAAIVAGTLLIAVGETWEWGWTRLVGAFVISASGTLFGVLLGWSEPGWSRIRDVVRRSARLVLLVLAAIILVPLIVGLLVSFAGLFAGDQEAGAGLLVAGSVVMVFLLAVTVGLAAEALRLALRTASGTYSPDAERSNGKQAQ